MVSVNPRTLELTRIRTPRAGPSDVAVGDGAVWAVSSSASFAARVDPRTHRVTRTTATGSQPSAVAVGDGAAWVANLGDDTVTHLDARTGKRLGPPIEVGSQPAGISIGAGAVWVANSAGNSVSRIDPGAGRVTATIGGVGQGPADVSTGLGYVWVANSRDGTLARIDPAQQQARRETPSGGQRPHRRHHRLRLDLGGEQRRQPGRADRTMSLRSGGLRGGLVARQDQREHDHQAEIAECGVGECHGGRVPRRSRASCLVAERQPGPER